LFAQPEIVGYDKLNKQFADRDAVLLGLSTDSEYVHLAWRTHHADMNKISMPMLADIKRELATACGILHKDAGVALRATFIVDPENVIRHVQVNDLSVGRSLKKPCAS
jgi:peroxiredoxin (alkyl hydroperoxide reductase subunit C)